MNNAAVLMITFIDGTSNLLAILFKKRESVTFFNLPLRLIFGLLRARKLSKIILSYADSIASRLGLCPAYWLIRKFRAA
eukprot:Gb_19807 [translate_table: standard]